ncbi:XRE family transcriptional regulator [Clostridium botulinum]|uniref:helix-turn-helix domain-containing protein n=1 Tax=Clostridium botulinum TaxID=1491 RepID=UPI00196894AB|nr:helix-turn-helix transcriptional regulator [Clostridium botulinum]MBN1071533.1 XRE family transcriptional regulator [Clostridium botulinum]
MIIFNLRVLMAKKKINMQQLSEETGIRRATISAYYNETYRHLVKEHLNIFCRYFNCNISDLIEFIDDEEN